jgi:hypothetical protein
MYRESRACFIPMAYMVSRNDYARIPLIVAIKCKVLCSIRLVMPVLMYLITKAYTVWVVDPDRLPLDANAYGRSDRGVPALDDPIPRRGARGGEVRPVSEWRRSGHEVAGFPGPVRPCGPPCLARAVSWARPRLRALAAPLEAVHAAFIRPRSRGLGSRSRPAGPVEGRGASEQPQKARVRTLECTGRS